MNRKPNPAQERGNQVSGVHVSFRRLCGPLEGTMGNLFALTRQLTS